MRPRVLVFDLIGVLAEPSWRELARDPARAPWSALKTGAIAEDGFWGAEEAAAYRRALRLRDDRLALLRRLRDRGDRILVATNLCAAWADHLAATLEPDLIERWLVSARLGVAKPSAAFWAEVAAFAPAGSPVIDDQRPNCAAAEAAGFTAIWAWRGIDLAARLLTS